MRKGKKSFLVSFPFLGPTFDQLQFLLILTPQHASHSLLTLLHFPDGAELIAIALPGPLQYFPAITLPHCPSPSILHKLIDWIDLPKTLIHDTITYPLSDAGD